MIRPYLHQRVDASHLDDVRVDLIVLANVVLRHHGLGPPRGQGSVPGQRLQESQLRRLTALEQALEQMASGQEEEEGDFSHLSPSWTMS